MAIVVLVAIVGSCGHNASDTGVGARHAVPRAGLRPAPTTETATSTEADVGARLGAPAVGASPDPTSDASAPPDIPWLPALKQYAASLPPVASQIVDPVRFGERQPDGTYLRDGRKMTFGEILASAPKVACPPLMQIRLPDDWNKTPAASSSDKPASTGKTTSGLGDIFNPPQLPPPIPLPGGWNPGPIIGVNPPPPPPIFGGPPPPGHVPYEGEGIGPLYDPNPIIYNVMDGPPVDVAILHMGPYGVYGALAVLTRHTVQLFAGPNALGGMGSWTARITIDLPTQVTTWDPDPAYRHTVDGAYAVRLRIADMNNDGRDDMVVVMNWDDPAWTQGVNQFGWNGTWVYYQNWSGYFDEPFSPGGASREYDIAAYNSDDHYMVDPVSGKHIPVSPLPDLLGVQNPHLLSRILDPRTGFPYAWNYLSSEYYDHWKFKDSGPIIQPYPTTELVTPSGDCWTWCVDRTRTYDDYDHTKSTRDGLVTVWKATWLSAPNTPQFLFVVYVPAPLDDNDPFVAYGTPTAAEALRARPGTFEPTQMVDDYAVTFPSADSLQIAHSWTPAYGGLAWEFYTPRVLRMGGGTTTGITRPREVQVSDINADGLSDIVVLSDDAAYVLLNLGNRTFIITDQFPVTDDAQREAIGSLYSRTEKDMAVIDSPSSQVLVFKPIAK